MSRALPRYTKESVFTAPVQVTCISFSNDGRLLAAGFSNIARIWSVDEGRVLHNLIVDDNIEAVLWGPGNILYCGIASGYLIVKVMDEVNKEVRTSGFSASRKAVAFLALDTSGLQLAVGGEGEVTVWKLSNVRDSSLRQWVPEWTFFKELPTPPPIQGRQARVTSLSWTTLAVGHILVSYLHHGIITWDVESVELEPVSAVSLASVFSGNLSPNGRLFVVPNQDQSFDIYKTDTSVHLRNFIDDGVQPPVEQQFYCPPALFIHNGRWLLGGGVGKATMWHMETGMHTQTLQMDQSSPVTLMAANRRSFQGHAQSQIATVSGGPTVTLWHAQGSVLTSKQGTQSEISNICPTSVMWAFSLLLFACAMAMWKLSQVVV